MAEYMGENLRRVMAKQGLSLNDVVKRTKLDRRTVKSMLGGTNKPHPRTIHRLARGLGVSPDEFFVRPAQLLYQRFDRGTNPVVQETIRTRPDLFSDWTEADFDELHSRFGSGGGLTPEGALKAASQMNRKRELQQKLALLLESSQAELVGDILDRFYREIVVHGR